MLTDKQRLKINNEFEKYISKIEDSFIMTVVTNFHNIYGVQFMEAPAAKKHHSNYPGGLLEHSIKLLKIAESLSKSMDVSVDKDLIIAGCIFHDAGKVLTYVRKEDKDGKADYNYTDRGSVLGHKYLGLTMLRECLPKPLGSDRVKVEKIEHIILTHDSSVRGISEMPAKTMEAIIVSYADMLEFLCNRWNLGAEKKSSSVYDTLLRKNLIYSMDNRDGEIQTRK